MTNSTKLLIIHLLCHLMIIPAIMYGELWMWLGSFLWWQWIAATSISAGYHRFFSHSSFRTGSWYPWYSQIVALFANPGPVLTWASTHRMHHYYSDTDKDGKSSFEERKRTEVYKWLSRNGNGFINPESIREGWHWENVGVRDQIYELPIQGADLIGNDSTETPPEEASNG